MSLTCATATFSAAACLSRLTCAFHCIANGDDYHWKTVYYWIWYLIHNYQTCYMLRE